jgi:hypothetical protein
MHHQNRHLGAAQHVLGEAAEYPFTQSAVAISTHHHQGRVFPGRCEQRLGRAACVGLQMSRRCLKSVPEKVRR